MDVQIILQRFQLIHHRCARRALSLGGHFQGSFLLGIGAAF
jgi:hypothetical protein